ncbi:hypothetical protein ACOCJ7_09960 [Knoellia sp. CPCC 206453]|uniref:hypothetical protein n=1 Tax=Knoellia pratensis TaxID=3404796 RepID=UPI00361A5C7F
MSNLSVPLPPVARRSGADIWRWGVMALLLSSAAALIAFQQSFRHMEAVLASHLFDRGGVSTFAGTDDVVVFLLPDSRVFALEVTPECTAAFLIAPFALIGAGMLVRRRLDPARVLLGVSLAAVLLLLANQLRLGVIAGMVTDLGLDRGYQWGHLFVGSFISVVLVAVSAAVALLVIGSGYRGFHEVSGP